MPSDSIMSSNSIRGGSSDGDEEEPQQLDLLSLYQSDIGHKILSYASGTDLCSIDVLSKQFQGLTADRWKVVTEERFGMNFPIGTWPVHLASSLGAWILSVSILIRNDKNRLSVGIRY